jgi:NADPH:quinone reductase-like Zn-dependent oxidoreductase
MMHDIGAPKMSYFGTQCAGHEGAGVIVKVGDAVKTLKPGMRAGIKVLTALHVVREEMLTIASLLKILVACASSVDQAMSATALVSLGQVS